MIQNLEEGYRGEPNWSAPEELVRLGRRRKQQSLLWIVAVLGDLAAITIAYQIGGIVRLGDPFHEQVMAIFLVVLPLYCAIGVPSGVFSSERMARVFTGIRTSTTAFLVTLCAVLFVIFMLKVSEEFSRVVFFTGGLLALLVTMPLGRIGIAVLAKRLIGSGSVSELLITEGDVRVTGLDSAFILAAEELGTDLSLDNPAFLDRLGQCVFWVDRVIVACHVDRRALWATALRGAGVVAEIFAPELDHLHATEISNYHDRRTLVIARGPLSQGDRLLKRSLDLVLSIASLPLVLPVVALVTIAIKLDSPGPVFFLQERVGYGNRLFRLYKFRSMYVAELDHTGARSTGRDDERITRVGRFIRGTSLDELPQIFNVISGAMSLVGPRPHALGSRAEDQLFWDIDTAYWNRHAVKPGLTGLAQVRGHRGNTERVTDLRNRLDADLEYLSGWTVWRDIKIIARTFPVLVHRNAF